MRVLIDECIDRRIKPHLLGHDVWTVQDMGWVGKQNGELLREMIGSKLEVLLTVDKSIQFQQNIQSSGVALLVMKPKKNKIKELMPLIPDVLAALGTIKPGEVVEVGHLP